MVSLCKPLVLSSLLLILLHLHHHPVNSATVDGCDGHLCSTANEPMELFDDEEHAILFSRCHAACLEKVAKADLLNTAREGNNAWPMISLETLRADNCVHLKEVMECRRGCIIKNSNSPGGCRATCRASCRADCPDGTNCRYNNTNCPVGCANDLCKRGCETVLPGTAQVQRPVPPRPQDPPALTETSSLRDVPNRPAGIYQIKEYQIPTRNSSGRADISGALFKLEVNSTTNLFLYQTSITAQNLNLNYFACQNVQVSFAVVTQYSISEYSPATDVCVYGAGRYPSQLSTSDITISLAQESDDRVNAGYGNNVVVNVSWNKPRESHLVTTYTLILSANSEQCPSILNSNSEAEIYNEISGASSFFVVRALAPDRAPRIGCLYRYTFQVFPNNTADYAFGYIDLRDPAIVHPGLSLNCSTTVDERTGLISATASWILERRTQHEGADPAMYTVTYAWVNLVAGVQTGPRFLGIDTVTAYQNGSASSTITGLPPNTAEDARLKIEVTPVLPTSSQPDSGIAPAQESCQFRVLPLGPSIINSSSIEVLAFRIETDSVHLNLTWDEPELPYGTIENYQVRLLQEMTKSVSDVDPSALIAETHINMHVELGEEIVLDTADVEIPSPCLYIQVRAKNQYYWGNWSDSKSLLLEPNKHTSCETVSPVGVRGSNSSSSSFPMAAWAGIGVAACIFLALCLLCGCLCVCICRRHRMKVRMKRAFENGYSNPMFVVGGRALQRRNSSLRVPLTLTHGTIELDDWEIPVGSVIVDTKFGEGCFGEVHRGVVRGPLPSTRTMKSNICVTVAIKMLKTTATGSERTDFLHEIDTMKKIAEGNNPHVITFIGCVTVQEPLCLITEFVKYGDLLSYLETIRKLVALKNRRKKFAQMSALKEPEPYLEPRMQGAVVEEEVDMRVVPSPDSPYAALGEVEPVSLISFAYQIATGMEYLSSLDIVHRDLACRNILIGEHKNLKISDFGMSRVVTGDDIYVKTTKGRLPWKWMAIESIMNREFTHASDVWSYGVTLWEIATLGGFPYPMISNAELLDHLKRGCRLECPENCSPEIYKVMLECWNEAPDERKTFPELRSLFDAMLAENNPYIQFENINTHKPYYNTSRQSQTQPETTDSSLRNSRSEDENMIGLSESEIDFEASSTSTSTLNIASSATGAYDYLRPIVPNVEVTTESEQPLQVANPANPYVETPTFKFLMNQDSLELSNFELELERIQQSDEMESSTEVPVEINSSANSAVADE